MHQVETKHPRLLFVTLQPPIDLDEARVAAGKIRDAFMSIAPTKSLLCTNVCSAHAWPPPVVDVFLAMMRSDNPLLECNGILFTAGGSMGLQVARLVREAGLKDRRFASSDPLDLLARYVDYANADEIMEIRGFFRLGLSSAPPPAL